MTESVVSNSIFTTKFKIRNAINFFNKVSTDSNYALYLFAGRPQPWDDEEDPPTIEDNVQTIDYEVWRDMIYAKKIGSQDIYFCIPRYDWTTGTVYTMYDDKIADLDETNFCVLTEDKNIYICLYNNGLKPSTIKPSGTETNSVITTADGYVWKFMLQLSDAEYNSVMTSTYIPIKIIESDDSSLQWEIQQNANDGGIDKIVVTFVGVNYDVHWGVVAGGSTTTKIYLDRSHETDASSTIPPLSISDNRYVSDTLYIETGPAAGETRIISSYNASGKYVEVASAFSEAPTTSSTYKILPTITINGDGSNCEAIAIMSSSGNSIADVVILNEGSGYTRNIEYDGNSVIQFTSNGGSLASAIPIIAPKGGHGYNALYQLYGYNIMIKTELNGDEDGTLTINNDYRRFGLLENPKIYNSSSAFSNNYAIQSLRILTSNTSDIFTPDQIVVDEVTGANGIVVDFVSNTLFLTRTTGTFANGDTIVQSSGSSLPISATIDTVINPDMEPFEGNILLVANREPIARSDIQLEEFSLIFSL